MNINSIFKPLILSFFILVILGFLVMGQEKLTYQMPPKEISELVDAQQPPSVMVSPNCKTLIILQSPALPSIEELAQPELRLAGICINLRTNGPSLREITYYNKMSIKDLTEMKEYPITGLPENPKIFNIAWSPNAKKIAFLLIRPRGIELWVVQMKDRKAQKLTEATINAIGYWPSFQWLSDSKRILFKAVIENRGNPPPKSPVPEGPVVQSNEDAKKAAPVRTYQDLLKNRYDEELFVFYASSKLLIADVEQKKVTSISKPGIIRGFSTSPDGKYILEALIKRPFSYLVPYYLFPQSIEILDTNGRLVKTIADIPSGEDIPKEFDAVIKGPRSFGWRADVPAVLCWSEAQDGGDPKKDVDIRDKLFFLAAPFTGEVINGPELKYRYERVDWGTGNMAMITERWRKTKKRITHLFQPNSPEKPLELIFDISMEDQYNNPGTFFSRPNHFGRHVILTDKTGQYLYLIGRGASLQGERPFIDKYDLNNKKTNRMWQSSPPFYEKVVSVIDINKKRVLIRREGEKIQPNYFIRNLKSGRLKQITNFPHPFPKLKDVEKQLIRYKREDGIELTGDLYLPPGYKKADGPLPVLMWAYPIEFKSKFAASQVTGSPYQFIYMNWWSPAIWVTQGYAVLDGASMPIVGEGDNQPNDTYIEQLLANARAAIDKLVEMGVGDRTRVGVGGHSYGAFMVANLLAHSRLFAAGIARSGAYNRTLTPFGFQQEERSLWESPDIYISMSPFMYAHMIMDPILLIHGEADNKVGTFPIQSERFYHALKGHGATVRLVLLPFEDHWYDARESIMHVMWETYNWLNKYVKNKKSKKM